MLPRQLIAESKKNDDWCKDTIGAIRQMIDAQGGNTQRTMMECYNLLNGRQDAKAFEYLTGKGDLRMPAKVRFLPIIRPYFDMLTSTMESRPLEPHVYAVDGDSLEEKQDLMARRIVEQYIGEVDSKQQRIMLLQQRIQMSKQSAMAQQDQVAQMSMGMMDVQMKQMEASLARNQNILHEQIETLEREFSYSFQTQKEMVCTLGLEYLFEKNGLREKFVEGLRDLYTVDNAIYALNDLVEGKDPSLRRVSPLDLFHSGESGVRHLRDCSWIVERSYMSAAQVLDEFGDDMSPEDVSDLECDTAYAVGTRYTDVTNWDASSLGMGSGNECDGALYTGTSSISPTIEVVRCSWLSPRRISYKEISSKHGGEPFLKLISDDEADRKPRKNQVIKHVYVNDRYTGVCINGKTFVRLGKAAIQLRDPEDYGTSHQPYAGFAYNDSDNRPYSRVWAVRDIQILYNLVYYQMELLLAMAGIKAFVMDKAQMPKDMKMDQFIYNLRQGIIWIDSSRPSGGRPSNFNQFQAVDLTFGNSIAQTAGILSQLEALAGRVIGIPPQRMGEISPNDQVGTNKQAIVQSNLTTEVIFYKMHRVIKQSVDMLLQVIPHAWANGKRGQFVVGRKGQKILKIAAGELGSAKFECFFPDRGKEEQKMDNALAMITNSAIATQMPVSQMISLFNTNSLHELENLLSKYEGLAMRKAAEGQQAQAEHEKELAQLEAQSQQALKTVEAGGEKLKAQVDQAALQVDERNAQIEAQTKLQVAGIQADSVRYKSDQESVMEAANLAEQKREHNMEAQLRSAELMMDQVDKQEKNLSSTPTKEKVT